MERPVFIYDGDCAFCSKCAQFVDRRISTPAHVVPWQAADLAALDLTVAQCAQAVQWVSPDGTRAAGPDAIALLLSGSGPRWAAVGRLLRLAPIRLVAWPVYRLVAANRHRLPGATAACAIPRAGIAPPTTTTGRLAQG